MHRNPELSTKEYETTRFLAAELEKSSIPYKLGPDSRGIVVDLGHPNTNERLAIRADIDAIPIHDVKTVDYRSTVDNVMHACGHDVHSSILLATVRSIHQMLADQPSDRAVRAIFQPEEETATGASAMIEFGVLKDVTKIIAGHVDPTRDVGKIGLRPGVLTAHCIELAVEIQGRGGHAARPHETVDPIELATRFITRVYQAVPRYEPEKHPVVVSFTSFHGGESSNVIPDRVQLTGTMRSLEPTAREIAVESLKRIAGELATETGSRIEIDFGLIVPSVEADEALTNKVRSIGEKLLGKESMETISRPSMGGEDFAFYSQKLPATMVRLGCRGPRAWKFAAPQFRL